MVSCAIEEKETKHAKFSSKRGMGNIKSLCCDTQLSGDETSRIAIENNEYGACNQDIVYNIVFPDRITITQSIDKPLSQAQQSKPPICFDTLSNSSSSIQEQSGSEHHSTFIKQEYCSAEFERIRSFMIRNPGTEKDFRECIWSCMPWSAPGGKSGSTFFKTSNDQFILKQMTKVELQTFLGISQSYFAYIEESYNFKRPTVLSVILGIYKIIYKDITTNTSSKYNFMVMPNLFYGKNIGRKFDLKGSTRNRLVVTDDPENCEHVLQDENLRRITVDRPLMISAKSKTKLNSALGYDSEYLSSISVMDYSLLVGIDETNKNLVVGIIDYVRPFTWDKRLEHVVKSVGSTEMPTIVEPGLYRTRFCEAMDKYFESYAEK